MNNRDELNRASRDRERMDELRSETLEVRAEPMEARASGVLEREVTIEVDAQREQPRKTKQNETDKNLEKRADSTTEKVLDKAGSALRSAAPTVGRGAEAAVKATGSLLSAASGPLGTIVGKIAGRAGGWWSSASQAVAELPKEEEKACRVHFEAYMVRPAGMTYERALPGYTLGYVAARNPEYRGRRFEEIEPDLRHGLAGDYDDLRDFARYGYERGTARL